MAHLHPRRRTMVGANITVDRARCTLCQQCVRFCPSKVFRLQGDAIIAEEKLCIVCYGCIKLCPTQAIKIKPRGYTIISYTSFPTVNELR
uniref:4Fe-4S ferredoxin-type domain-containing protein n=1 Tax=Ignisphaera aggregans TaxID=334771 RepID=A0A7C2ZUK3_9CREN